MGVEEIKEFLRKRRGYLKEGAGRLAKHLNADKDSCKVALREVRLEAKAQRKRKFRRLFFDIETSPNIGWFWRTSFKTKITPNQIREERKVICVSYKWEGEDKVYHLKWDDNKNDEQLLRDFSKVLLEANEVIAHNGDRFDIPWLRTRCIYFGIPFPTYIQSLDTLKKVRSMFDFQSNRLDYIAKFLGLGGKIPIGTDVWEQVVFVPTRYKEYKEAMNEMLEYCDYDVVLLEDVFNKINNYIKPNTHVGVHQGKGKHSCPRCGSEHTKLINTNVTPGGNIKRHIGCKSCGSDFVMSNTAYKKFVTE